MEFKFSGGAADVPVPENLSNTERAMLRELAAPGNPLWKIFRSMIDYGESLKNNLVGVDLNDPVEVNAARKVQATIIAIDWVQATFEQALTDVETEEQN